MQRHLLHAAIPLAIDGPAEVPPLAVSTSADLLAWSDLFGILVEPQRYILASAMGVLHLVPGETPFAQGDAAEAVFVVPSGTVGIIWREQDGTEIVQRLSPRMTLGAIGLIKASPYGATATALTPVKTFHLDRAAITAAIAERPNLMEVLEDLARRGQAAISADIAASRDHRDERPDLFLSRMRGFLQRLAAGLDPVTQR